MHYLFATKGWRLSADNIDVTVIDGDCISHKIKEIEIFIKD